MTLCTIEDCDKPARTRGLCAMHYQRLLRHGDVAYTARQVRAIEPGARFGRLVVQDVLAERASDGHRVYRCLCDCGNETSVPSGDLKSGNTRSCGCLYREHAANMNRTHGMSHHPLYVTWCCMKRRCYKRSDTSYADYGGRGITVDLRWMDFPTFLRDMGEKPSPSHLLDRIDNDGPYSPENCRWATATESEANKRPHGTAVREAWKKEATEAVMETITSASPNALAPTLATYELAERIVEAVFSRRVDWRTRRPYSK